jgi:hypothetical protein
MIEEGEKVCGARSRWLTIMSNASDVITSRLHCPSFLSFFLSSYFSPLAFAPMISSAESIHVVNKKK